MSRYSATLYFGNKVGVGQSDHKSEILPGTYFGALIKLRNWLQDTATDKENT